ncbi:MAG: magnesium chelatase family protein [Cellvibrionaceae bacterium]
MKIYVIVLRTGMFICRMQYMSLAIVHTRARLGIDAPPVTVEVHLSNGLPSLSIVGLPETAVKESKDRVRSALLNSLFEFPARRITINLAPADLPKDGSRFDLAIAIGILAASDQIPKHKLEHVEFIGELALSGDLRGVDNVLSAAIACTQVKRALVVAAANSQQASLCEHATIYKAKNLLEVCAHLHQQKRLEKIEFSVPAPVNSAPDFNEVRGQYTAKRALEITAAGGHNILLYGPPGTGKTMLARRLPSIMPLLSQAQSIEVANIHSLCGYEYNDWQLPPFRNPHHTASAAALVGGGGHPRPGEISLAHNGVLFLDEFPEFQRQVLEVLREPLESGEIRISRVAAQLIFPAKFQLVAAMNPCPCGYLTSSSLHVVAKLFKACRCTEEQIRRYRQKISGPLLDRIDLHIPVVGVSVEEMTEQASESNADSEPSDSIRERVVAAYQRQLDRQGCKNAQLHSKQLVEYCYLGQAEKEILQHALSKLGISARAYHRVVKVARTIADLDDIELIQAKHIAEALSLRNFDRSS